MTQVLFGFQISTLHKERCSCNSAHSGEQNYLCARACDALSGIHHNNYTGCFIRDIYVVLVCVSVDFGGGWWGFGGGLFKCCFHHFCQDSTTSVEVL